MEANMYDKNRIFDVFWKEILQFHGYDLQIIVYSWRQFIKKEHDKKFKLLMVSVSLLWT